MNTTYISMCREAKELQEEWEPKEGDCYYLECDLFGEDWGSSTLCPKKSTKYKNKELDLGIYYIGSEMGVIQGYCDWETYDPETVQKNSVWLPRQEDLQEIMKTNWSHGKCELLVHFHQFSWNHIENRCKKYDFNELWLLCVMEYVFSKVWVDGEWVKQ